MFTGENRPMRAKERWNKHFMRLLEQFFELGNVSQKQAKALIRLEQCRLKIYNHLRMYKKY
jgi:hypothetical protein